MKKTTLSIFCLAIFAAGCSTTHFDVPSAQNFPARGQNVLASSAHWNVIAREMTSELVKNIKAKGNQDTKIGFLSVHNRSSFSTAFNEMLKTSLVNQGYSLSFDGSNDLVAHVNFSGANFSDARYSAHTHVNADTQESGNTRIVRNTNSLDTTATPEKDRVLFDNAAAWGMSWSDPLHQVVPKNEIVITVGVFSNSARAEIARLTNTYYLSENGQYFVKTPEKLNIINVK